MRRPTFSVLLALCAILALSSLALGFTGATNGGFEAGTNPPTNRFRILNNGSTDLSGWTVTTGSVDWIGGYWQAAEGTRSLDLSGNAAGAVSQTFATNVGNTYVVSFYLSGNPDRGPVVKTLKVTATGSQTATFTFDTTGISRSAMGWTRQEYPFVATSPTTTLTFASATAGSYGPALDNVVVTQVVRNAADCKRGGWQTTVDGSGDHLVNQGDCVAYFASDGKNRHRHAEAARQPGATWKPAKDAKSGPSAAKSSPVKSRR